MRNLILLLKSTQKITNDSESNPINKFLIDGNNRTQTYFLTKNEIYTNPNNNNNNGDNKLYKFDSSLADSIISAQHLSLNDELSLATMDGEIILLNLQSLTTESVAFCDGGISKMCWSPDQEVVVFLTINNILVVMDSSYSIIGESVLDNEQFGDGAFVNVGWGRKETQFHGTEGKAAAKQKPLSDVQTINESMENEDRVEICWRGDSEYFVISFIAKNHNRLFKVYDKEGNLQFTSEKTIGLMAPICWRPTGPWICIPQILPNKYVVALFEKNGLKHREIVLPFIAEEEFIVNMDWSSDSDILAIETLTKSTNTSTIYLFTMVNYHWYQKQTIKFNEKIISFEWDQRYTEGKQLHILLNNQEYLVYRYDYVVNHSRGFDKKTDESLVGVIDGCKLFLTNFRGSVVPPPMCSYTLTLDTAASINIIDFINFDLNTNQFIIVDTENMLSRYETIFENGCLINVELKYKFKLPMVNEQQNDVATNNITHLCWLNNEMFCISYESKKKIDESFLLVCNLSDSGINVIKERIIIGQINRIIAANENEIFVLLFSLKNGLTVVDYQLNETLSSTITSTNPLERVKRMTKLTDQIAENILVYHSNLTLNTIVFLFKSKQWLMMNDKLICDDATSIFLTEQYLLYTTFDKLKFIRLSDGLMVNERRVERGSRLVCVVPKTARTVLQMPRGNLEVIQPRVLSLCIIGDLLDNGEYYAVFELLRKQRINLNLIIDHNPMKFYNEIEKFISLVNNPSWLNLFLSDLINEDVTITMYNSNYINELVTVNNDTTTTTANAVTTNKSTSVEQFDFKNKINLVCDKLREVIEKSEKSNQLLLPILTSYCKQNNLEKALEIVWNLKQTEVNGNDSTAVEKQTTNADAALKYLLYLIDINQLYNVALGMYDFGLVLFVATKSNKDPKEYIPFLNELKKETNLSYRYYRIDLFLKRFEKALVHIIACGDEYNDQMIELVCQHQLYKKAMKLYANNIENIGYTRVVFQYGEYLREKGKFRDACLMYERSKHYDQAILTAKHILDTDRCIQLATKMNQTPEQIKHFVGSLIPALIENGHHLNAAELTIRYQSDYERAINILCNGKLYSKSIYVANFYKSIELIEKIIKPHLKQYAEQLIVQIGEDSTLYKKYKDRLIQLRHDKNEEKKKKQNINDGLNDLVDDNIDMISESNSYQSILSYQSSQSSRGTGKTHRSSKNRRKHEKKLLNLKEGNQFEDIALIDALYSLIIKIFDQQLSTRYLLISLLDLQFDEICLEIQINYKELLTMIQSTLNDIWIPEMIVSGEIELGSIDMDEQQNAINQAGVIDFAALQEKRHYSMIKIHQRFKPTLKLIDWELDITS